MRTQKLKILYSTLQYFLRLLLYYNLASSVAGCISPSCTMASYVNSKCELEISEKGNGLCSISQLFVLDAFQVALLKALNVGIEPKGIHKELLTT